MKRILAGLLILFLLLPSVGLAAATIDPSVNRNISPPANPANHPPVEGESMVTGLPVSAEYLPILVNIDNVAGAWPQWGIGKADIIYEMPIQGLSLTRLMALFAYEHPSAVGPVRSGRIMHAEMREEWDCGWVYVGVQKKAGSSVNTYLSKQKVRSKPVNLLFDGTGRQYAKYFERMKGYKSPHNHSINLTELAELVRGYSFPERPFLFADAKPTTGDVAERIDLVYGSRGSYTNSSFVYDESGNFYSRYRAGKPFADKDAPDTPLAFSNVIVQWTNLTFNGASNAPLLTLVGQGNADIFVGGKHIAGYWIRKSVNSRTVFLDQDGQEIQLQRGKTFINITTQRSTTVTYE